MEKVCKVSKIKAFHGAEIQIW